MDVEKFHGRLLGIDQKRTPDRFWFTEDARQLYEAHAEWDVRGFSSVDLDEDRFLATFVLALSLTGGEHPVCMAVPRQHTDWAMEQIKEIARHIFRERQGNTAAIIALRKAIGQLVTASRVLQIDEPERWVAFGFHREGLLPEWMRGKLL